MAVPFIAVPLAIGVGAWLTGKGVENAGEGVEYASNGMTKMAVAGAALTALYLWWRYGRRGRS